jgi:hypothetical protein
VAEAIRRRAGRLAVGRTTWCSDDILRDVALAAPKARIWRVGRRISTVRWGRYTFRRLWLPVDELGAVLESLLIHDLPYGVSSWGAVWRHFSPRQSAPAASVRRILRRGTWPYNWLELRRKVGPLEESAGWQEWDIRGAYPWASSQGLPDAAWLEVGKDHTPDDAALHLVDGVVSVTGEPEPWILPPWLRRRAYRRRVSGELWGGQANVKDPPLWVPGHILNALCLAPVNPQATLRWRKEMQLTPAFDQVRQVFRSCPWAGKRTLAAHWGSWISRRGVKDETWERGECVRSRELPPLANNPAAAVMQGRVHARISGVADHAARIFVDSALLPREFNPTPRGNSPGDWRPKGEVVKLLRQLPWRPV